MKKYLMLALGLAVLAGATGGAAGRSADAAELIPVQLLCIDAQGGSIRLTTDTGDIGSGKSMEAAFADLKAGCAGQLFTQTAEHVVLTRRAWYLAPQVCVSGQLRPAAHIYRVEQAPGELAALLAFLQAHPGQMTLSRMRALLLRGEQAEPAQVRRTEGGFRLGA